MEKKSSDSASRTFLEEQPINIHELVGLFLDRKWIILGVTIAAFLGGSVFFGIQPNQYFARCRLLVESPSQEPYFDSQQYKDLVILPQRSNEFYNTQIALIKSAPALVQLVNTVGIKNFVKETDPASQDMSLVIELLNEKIEVLRVPGTQLFDIEVILNDPVLTAKIANTLAELYIDQYKSQILSSTKEFAQKILSGEAYDKKDDASYEAIEDMLSLSRDSEVGRLRVRRQRFQTQWDALSIYYSEEHPDMQAIKKSMVNLDAEIEKEIEKTMGQWKSSLNGQYLLDRVKIVEFAAIPKKAIGPKRLMGILFVTFFGLAGSCGLVFLLHQLDPKIKTEEDLIKEIGIVCLGIVPRVSPYVPLDNFPQLPSELKDIFANIRTAILFSMQPEKSKVILLTSTLRFEGRTTMAMNLACSFANDGFKTVLLDADTRQPRVHRIFQIEKNVGLTNLLKGETDLESIMLHSEIENLTVIPAGESVYNPSELLSQAKMGELMKTLREKFDKVIIDTPPLLNLADQVILSALSDGVILVINAGKTDKRMIKRMMDDIKQINEVVIGGIINRYDITKHSYYLNAYYKEQIKLLSR